MRRAFCTDHLAQVAWHQICLTGTCLSIDRYDVELFQRIEALTGQRMEQFSPPEDAVMLLLERTNEAQRIATMQVIHLQDGGFWLDDTTGMQIQIPNCF